MYLIFLSSSDFAIPILESINQSQKEKLKLGDLIKKQLAWLKENQEKNLKLNFVEYLELESNLQKIPPELLNQNLGLKLIITQPDRINRKKTIQTPIKKFCLENNLQIFTPEKLNQEYQEIKEVLDNCDLAITASYGQIISEKILSFPKYGFINWHPSLLPKYRGATPMQTALLNGDSNTGLSWIEMTKKMDAGKILLQIQTQLNKEVNFSKLAWQMANFGQNTWSLAASIQILKKIKLTNITQVQDETQVSFCGMISKDHRLINPSKQTAKEIYNHFRAYEVFPRTSFLDLDYFRQEIKIEKCNIIETLNPSQKIEKIYENLLWKQIKENKKIRTLLKCKNNTELEITKIKLLDGRTIDFSGYIFLNC